MSLILTHAGHDGLAAFLVHVQPQVRVLASELSDSLGELVGAVCICICSRESILTMIRYMGRVYKHTVHTVHTVRTKHHVYTAMRQHKHTIHDRTYTYTPYTHTTYI